MKTKSIKQSAILPCAPEVAYHAWLDSREHGLMTGGGVGDAKIDPRVDGKFNIWGAATGQTLEIDDRKHRIVQSWRYDYDDWPKDQPSKLIVEFTPHKDGQCKLRFWQSGLPEKYAADVADGWKKYYWAPMKEYFKNAS